ncbi:MAG: DUF1311 domain-containing protein [Oxalobacter sp.]|nr:DUF1311 domain-containing protein [Oxalobacter sp.]
MIRKALSSALTEWIETLMKICARLFCFSILPFLAALPVFAIAQSDVTSYDQWQAQVISTQELKKAEKRLQTAYQAAKKALGEKTTEAGLLSREQQAWDKARRAQALIKGAPGSPAFNQELISQAKERVRLLDAITKKGRVLSYHQYQLTPGQAMTGFMRVWQYEDGHAHVIIHTRHDENPVQCEINTESARHENGAVTFHATGQHPVSGTIIPYDQGYRARVEINEGTQYCPQGTDITGLYVRADMPVPAGDATFENVASCELGEDHSQALRVLRSQPVGDSHIYYIESKKGLRPLSLFAGESIVKPYEALEHSRGSQVRISCAGEKEKVLLISGEFWSNFINIFTFRYNTAHREWQILYTAQRGEPSLIYLNNDEMRLIIPNPDATAPGNYTVRSHVIGKGYSRYDDKGNLMDSDSLPDPVGFTVIPIRNNLSF